MEFRPGTGLSPPSNERLEWFEKVYRVALPADYVNVLQEANGAVPLTNLFDQGSRERLIERMLCLLDHPQEDDANGWNDIAVVISQVETRLTDDEALIGMNVIPIATLFGGDLVCLDYRESTNAPTVSVWDHEQSADFRPHLEMVARSFSDFANLLRKQ